MTDDAEKLSDLTEVTALDSTDILYVVDPASKKVQFTNLQSSIDHAYSPTGTLTLGGIGNTNNERIALDFESTANTIAISSSTSADKLKTSNIDLELSKSGAAKSTTNILKITNTGNAADMDGTGTGILFNQWYYDATTPAVADAGRIACITETDWTSTASTQDSYLSFQSCLNGTVAEKMCIKSNGYVGINQSDPTAFLHITGEGVSATQNSVIINDDIGASTNPNCAKLTIGNTDGLSELILGQRNTNNIVFAWKYNAIADNAWAQIETYGGNNHLLFMANGDANVGVGIPEGSLPTSKLEIQKSGTVKVTTDIVEITNSGNAADMDATKTGLLFNQFYYDATTPAKAELGRIVFETETDWTSTASTQDSKLGFQVALNGTLTEQAFIKSNGDFHAKTFHFTTASTYDLLASNSVAFALDAPNNSLGSTAITCFSNSGFQIAAGDYLGTRTINTKLSNEGWIWARQAGTAKATTDILTIENSGNASDMDGTGTAILFNQYYYDGSTPAAADAGRIACITETDWTSTASTQDSYLSFQTAEDGSVSEGMKLTSDKKLQMIGAKEYTLENGNFECYKSSGSSEKLMIGISTSDYGWIQAVDVGNDNLPLLLQPDGNSEIGIFTNDPSSPVDIYYRGTVSETTDIVEITNGIYDSSMTGTGASIIFKQAYYDVSTPLDVTSARIASITETDWTSTASTQDSYLSMQTANGGSVTEKERITSVGGKVFTPTGTHSITAGTGITADMLSYISRIAGNGGAVTISATPSVAGGIDGQIVIFQGTDNTNTVTFQDESNLSGSKLQLCNGADSVLGQGDTLMLTYDSGDSNWYEVSRSNN